MFSITKFFAVCFCLFSFLTNIYAVVVVVVKKAAGMGFLKVTLPDGVFSQPPVIQVSTFSLPLVMFGSSLREDF